jgi:glyoxylase-like metal-dependent hydrolase (beta-lactamase superfamily II)
VCFYEEKEKVMFCGDVVVCHPRDLHTADRLQFKGSVGRTDLPQSNGKDMIQSLRRLMALPSLFATELDADGERA